MMYSEFVEGTGCKQTTFNYNVFLALEEIYMNSDLTKEEIYAIGKMRVDNSETEAERLAREEIETAIAEMQERLDWLTDRIRLEEENVETYRHFCAAGFNYRDELKTSKIFIQNGREEKRILKAKIKMLKGA